VLAAVWVGLASLLARWFKVSRAPTEIVVGTVAQVIGPAFIVKLAVGGGTQWSGCLPDAGAMVLTSWQGDIYHIASRPEELDVHLETEVMTRHRRERLLRRAETADAHLIALRRCEMPSFERMLFGSSSEKVLCYSHCPDRVAGERWLNRSNW